MWSKLISQKKITLLEPLVTIKKELKGRSKQPSIKTELSSEERTLIEQIKFKTNKWNQNNITRTKAYLDFYQCHPEVHWAFLGHMVSRNGGWNMTDLKGGLLPRLLTKKECQSFFTFLERGNWLIFQDAFPQFLLYEESIKREKNLFYLLPHFHVSLFMEIIWNHFLEDCDSYTLTIALIINEQSYLELRVIDNPVFKKNIFNTLEFKLQDLLSMNQILFPYLENGKVKLIGETLHHFESLHRRILLGKRLYSILFADSKRLNKIEQWAYLTPHSGSRKDYWPHIFHDIDEGVPGRLLKRRLKSCRIIPGAMRFYSPKLEFVWKDCVHEEAEIKEWYEDWQVVYYLINSEETINGEIEDEYCQTLERIELTTIAKKAIFLRN
ncbi:DUF2515 domain-containing protein [Peribacillus asahii]|uniref:DUF2515 domain-containing protein n=1 Tax=Peribacillus asahii TaxID=228899 RepID=UPI002079E956|nr:DUF2515 domain-containing protein [Peribacillus asahii]USK61991.1 DUF2515 domain-containing protein [Peribacillus asahii]